MTDVDVTATDNADTPIDVVDVPDVLSPRQRGVYDMHKAGMTNVAIAAELDIAPGTVSNALVAALTKMGERNAPTSGDMDVTQMLDHMYTKQRDVITQSQAAITHAMGELDRIRAMAIVTDVALNDALIGDVIIDMGDTRSGDADASDGASDV